jgi:hypothetical protein
MRAISSRGEKADLEPVDAVALLDAGGEQNDRQVRGQLIATQPPREIHAAHPR